MASDLLTDPEEIPVAMAIDSLVPFGEGGEGMSMSELVVSNSEESRRKEKILKGK